MFYEKTRWAEVIPNDFLVNINIVYDQEDLNSNEVKAKVTVRQKDFEETSELPTASVSNFYQLPRVG